MTAVSGGSQLGSATGSCTYLAQQPPPSRQTAVWDDDDDDDHGDGDEGKDWPDQEVVPEHKQGYPRGTSLRHEKKRFLAPKQS